MKPILFSNGSFHIYGYGLMIAIGVIAAVWTAEKRALKLGLDGDKVFDIAVWGVIGGVIGSKVLYWIVDLPNIIKDPSIILNLGNGFVIYGAILGGILGGWLCTHHKKLNFVRYFDLGMPSVALAQGFGRIGCFLAGCCYGRETTSWFHVVFHESLIAPNGVWLIPTQLISSAANFVHFAVLIWIAKRAKFDGEVAGCYLIFYAVGRSIIEMFRADYRGSVGVLSTSQFISIFIFIAGVIILLVGRKFWPKEKGNGEAPGEASAPAEGQEA